MARVTRGFKARKRRKKVLDRAEGFRGRRKNCYALAVIAVERSLKNAYKGRKDRKRDFRALWIQRINAAVRAHGGSYASFMHQLKQSGIDINRKLLADMAVNDPNGFEQLYKAVA